MSHDLYASISSSLVANTLTSNQSLFTQSSIPNLSIYASREGKTNWPFADGVLVFEENTTTKYKLAVEFKRVNEGIHGILTALGQSLAYLKKGYNGTAIIIPETYPTHNAPGDYLKEVIDSVSPDLPIIIFTYTIDATGNLTVNCKRKIDLSANSFTVQNTSNLTSTINTQWAHLREGSTEPDTFYRYLQTAKRIDLTNLQEPNITIPQDLLNAIPPGVDPLKYLSNSVGDNFHDVVWRNFWFTYIINQSTITPFTYDGSLYHINNNPTALLKNDGTAKFFFVGRKDSIKNVIVKELNDSKINPSEAWKKYAEKIRDRAHSAREDIDSSLYHIGMIDPDGKPTNIGYKFVDACERNNNNSHTGTPIAIFSAAVIQQGELGAFLHYFQKASDEIFSTDPLKHSQVENNKFKKFDQKLYLEEVESILANDFKVMRKVGLRGGATRGAFQAELALLGFLGFFKNTSSRYRLAVGLDIDWEKVYSSLHIDL